MDKCGFTLTGTPDMDSACVRATVGMPPANQRGQAMTELAFVMVILVLVMMGIIEFGRAFMVANMITNAARDGARSAAALADGERGTCGSISPSYAPIAGAAGTGMVLSEISNVVDPTGLSVTIAQAPSVVVASPCPTPGSVPTVEVTVSGSVPYIFNLVGTHFSVNRSATFRDEGR
jgi:Flp pilus assembly protein TadG